MPYAKRCHRHRTYSAARLCTSAAARLVVALLARQQRLEAHQVVVVVERNQMLLAGASELSRLRSRSTLRTPCAAANKVTEGRLRSRCRYRLGGVNTCAPDGRAFGSRGGLRPLHQRPGLPNRRGYLPGKQIVPVEADARQGQGPRSTRAPNPDLFIAARTDAASIEAWRLPSRAANVHGSRRRYGKADGRRYHRRDQAGDARNTRPHMATLSASGVSEGAQPRRSSEAPASAPQPSPRSPCSRPRRGCATCCGSSSATIRSRPARSI